MNGDPFQPHAMKQEAAFVRCYIDQPRSWDGLTRCVIVKGWCFGANGQSIRAVRLRTNDLSFAGVVGLPRPDVKAALSAAPSDYTGFEVRGVLPSGENHIVIDALTSNDSWHSLLDQTVHIKKRWRPLWFPGSSCEELMFFQMAGHMKYAPRPLRVDRLPRSISPVSERPRISIVTPSFQQARFLSTTVSSVWDQKNVDCEYVVQDGGSTDGSIEILRQFAQTNPADFARSFAWASEPDSGQADAIARGFAKTSGKPDDLMAWINSDDFYLPGTLAYVADFFARHPNIDVIYGHRILVDEEGREIGRWFLPAHDDEVLRLNDFVPQETLFWRRRLWDKVGGIDASYKFAMDWDLLLRFQAAGARIVRVPYFLACFRIHSAQKTSAQMEFVGKKEIATLNLRTFGRALLPTEIETHPRLLRYLRKSAWIEFLWRRFHIRHP